MAWLIIEGIAFEPQFGPSSNFVIRQTINRPRVLPVASQAGTRRHISLFAHRQMSRVKMKKLPGISANLDFLF